MAKVIKLKQSDIQKIVENVLKEQQFDDFDTQVQPEERPGMEEYEAEVELALGQDDQGNFYVIKNGDDENPEIVAKA